MRCYGPQGDPSVFDTDKDGDVETDEAEAAAEAEGDTIADLMGAGDNPEMEAVVEEATFDELIRGVKGVVIGQLVEEDGPAVGQGEQLVVLGKEERSGYAGRAHVDGGRHDVDDAARHPGPGQPRLRSGRHVQPVRRPGSDHRDHHPLCLVS